MVAAIHRYHGVDLRTGVAVIDVFGESRHRRAFRWLRIGADVAVVGIGVIPNTEWLRQRATLDHGIVATAR